MKELLLFFMLIGSLFSMIIVSGGVLVWLAPVTEEQMTPAQETLMFAADSTIKVSAGAIAGLGAGGRMLNGKLKSAASR